MLSNKENYLLTEHKQCKDSFYILQCVNDKQSYQIQNKVLISIIQRYKLKIFAQVYQNGFILFDKEEIIEEIISQVQSSKISNCKKQIKNRHQLNICKCKKYVNLQKIFKQSQLSLITLQLWQKSYRLVQNIQFFQVIGRRAKSNRKIHDYLIKFKFFDNPQTFKWVRTTNFYQHPGLKVLNTFDKKNPINQILVINERYSQYKGLFQQKLLSHRKKRFQVLGKSKIGFYMFFLFKADDQDVQSSQWYMHYVIPILAKKQMQINEKIREYRHDIKKSPFIDREQIKKLLLEQINNNSSKRDNQFVIDYNDQMIEELVDQKVKLFISKFLQLKNDIHHFYQSSIGFNDLQSDTNKIIIFDQKRKDDLPTQLNQFTIKKNTKSAQYPTQTTEQQISFQHQNLLESSQSSVNKTNNYDNKTNNNNYSKQAIINSVQETKIETKSEQFYERIKQQFKQQCIQSLYLNNEKIESQTPRRIYIRRSSQQIQNTQSNYEEYQNTQSNQEEQVQNIVEVKCHYDQVKTKQQQTSTQIKIQQSISVKVQSQALCQNQKLDNSDANIVWIQIFQHLKKLVYRVQYDNGHMFQGSRQQLIQYKGIPLKLIKQAEKNYQELLINSSQT